MIATNKPIDLMSEDELYHFGVLNMKWGVRRYQNKDGSLTPLGRKRAKKLEAKYEKVTGKKMKAEQSSGEKKKAAGPKDPSKMSNKELQDAIIRKNLEDQYRAAFPKQVSLGEKVAKKAGEAIVTSVSDKASKVASEYVEKTLKNKLGLNDELASLKKETEKLKIESEKWKYKSDISDNQFKVKNAYEKGTAEGYKHKADKWKNKLDAAENKDKYKNRKKNP